MAKGISDIVGDISEAVARRAENPMAEMAGSVQDVEELLATLSGGDPEAADRLAPLLGQARAMNRMMAEIVAAEAVGDRDAVLALSQEFAAIADAPEAGQETDPVASALADAREAEADAAFTSVRRGGNGFGHFDRHLG